MDFIDFLLFWHTFPTFVPLLFFYDLLMVFDDCLMFSDDLLMAVDDYFMCLIAFYVF